MGGSMARKESRAPNGHPVELKKKKRPPYSSLLYGGLFCYGDPLICGNISVFRKSQKDMQAKQCSPKIGFSKKKSTILPTKYSAFLVENSGIEPLTSCMPCKRSPEPP